MAWLVAWLGIFVVVYFGRIVHGKHAVGASGICMMRRSLHMDILRYGTWWSLSLNLGYEAPHVARRKKDLTAKKRRDTVKPITHAICNK